MSSLRPYGRFLLPLVFAAAGAAGAAWLVPGEEAAVENHLVGFPDADAFGHLLRPVLLGLLCFLPTLGAIAYACAGMLDRYLFRQFFTAFSICFAGLLILWLLIDLSDNLNDLRQSDDFAVETVRFYLLQFPAVFVLITPYSLLLSLLYCLGRLSRSREIVAMIQTGRGVTRVVAPLIGSAMLAAAACAIFNYHWAPWAEGYKEILLIEAKGGQRVLASNVLYFDGNSRRLWKIGSFPFDHTKGEPLLDVEVTSQRRGGGIKSRLKAPRATWNKQDRHWYFEDAELGKFEPGQPPTFEKPPSPLVRTTWRETPWQLIKPGLAAPYLGIPDLNSWLLANRDIEWADKRPYLTQWHHRWAQPFVCVVTVLLAAPLGIVFSRRGATGGVALAVFLCAGMLFLSTISLALGESGYLPPAVAAWATNVIFGAIAVWLFHRRMVGLPIYQAIRRLLPLED